METLSALRHFLDSIHVPCHQLGSPATGSALVVREGGRLLALSAPGDDRNVLWTHPDLARCRTAAELATIGAGGAGGLRLWQAPENSYMWQGPAQPATFANYQIQPAMDPGDYRFTATSADAATLAATIDLEDLQTRRHVVLEIERTLGLRPLPDALLAAGLRGVTVTLRHHAHLQSSPADGFADLWNLLQLPAGTILAVPVNPVAVPSFYFNPERGAGWSVQDGLFTWPSTGRRLSKLGFSATALRGHPLAWIREPDRSRFFVWDFPVHPRARYADSPPGQTVTDQAVQFWDGAGFCEMECHSPALTPDQPTLADASALHYFELPGAHPDLPSALRALPSAARTALQL